MMAKDSLPLHLVPSQQVTDQTSTEAEASNESLESGSVDIAGHNSSSINTNNSQLEKQPITQTSFLPIAIRAFDVDPEEVLERGESKVLAPIEQTAYCHDAATDRYDLPIAVAVPIAESQDCETRDNSKCPTAESAPSKGTKTSEKITKEPILPLTSSSVGSLELSPAFKCILAILLGLTILLACAAIGTLVVKGIMYHYMERW